MNKEGTVKNAAIHWLSYRDEWTKDAITNIEGGIVPIERIAERYALAFMYYAGRGVHWRNNKPRWFLNGNASVCNWQPSESSSHPSQEGTYHAGVSCNDDGFVVGLDLCKYYTGR